MENTMKAALTAIGEATSKSCERCRRRKIKCDRRQPCSRCYKAKVECHRSGSGEKQRPIPRSHVQALEGQIDSLKQFIQRLASANAEERDTMLSGVNMETAGSTQCIETYHDSARETSSGEMQWAPARARTGKLRKSITDNSSQFYGPTSFQMHAISEANPISENITALAIPVDNNYGMQTLDLPLNEESPRPISFPYAPHDEIPQSLMSTFFKEQYPYNMCVYREFFLRDYDTGTGPYYSDLLFCAICATGALASEDPLHRSLYSVFSDQAQILLYSSLDKPTFTTLQALILLGYLEIGHGRPTKGWLFGGMAFRLAHEMGLHLDPINWQGASDTQIDMEIRRRVYWAAFDADKQLSIYFGRPPALYPHESDVRNTIRIPYPPDWEGLLDTYIAKGTSATAYEDGIALVGTFIYRVELSKIRHTMITELFDNRRKHADGTYLANTARQIHVALTKWLSDLPGKLHWNQWSVGQAPAGTLHLHMLFHTTMILLHRPPRELLKTPDESTTEDMEICNESVRAILKLLRTYSRFYHFRSLPLDFVHTLSTTASILLMQRDMEDFCDDGHINRSFDAVISAMDTIQHIWPCIMELRTSLGQQLQRSTASNTCLEHMDTNLGAPSFDAYGALWDDLSQMDHDHSAADLGPLITNDFLIDNFSWN